MSALSGTVNLYVQLFNLHFKGEIRSPIIGSNYNSLSSDLAYAGMRTKIKGTSKMIPSMV